MDSRLKETARHEAAHVVAHHACGHPVDRATIDPEIAGPGNAGAVWSPNLNIDSKPLHEFSDITLHELTKPPRAQLEGQPLSDGSCVLVYGRMIAALAGKEADRLFDRPSMPRTDMRIAVYFATCIAGTHEAALALIDRARADAKRILIVKKNQVEIVAAALLEYRTLDSEQIAAVLAGRPDAIRRKQWTAMAAGAEQFRAMTGGLRLLTI
jgi:hypothetical protein